MTKKDYQAIAKALHAATQTTAHEDARLAAPSATRYLVAHVVEGIARVLAADNPKFDRDTFVKACETGDVTRRPKRKTHVFPVDSRPLCVKAMGCYCAGHAQDRIEWNDPCDTRE